MELENVYWWFAFPSSRQTPNISVANRFFGIAPNGEHKFRGIALRRGDTPVFIAQTQKGVLDILAKEADPAKLIDLLPEVLEFVLKRVTLLKNRDVPPVQLIVRQTLSKDVKEYSALSHAAIAARQLQACGKIPRRGQQMRMIYTSPGPGVFAWDSSKALDPRTIDMPRYRDLMLRAVHEVLQSLGMTEKILRDWVVNRAAYLAPPGILYVPKHSSAKDLPLLTEMRHLRVDKI